MLAALVASLSSCAAGTAGGPQPVSMPAARAGLAPEYRIFYDALQDYGDWVLIEPYGYLFRPRVSYSDWRPYESGFWAPTDAYGWVWISNEPFGWATYHYGRWAYDEFQGWVWKPGVDWAPAWVDWRANDQYIGWAPLTLGGGAPSVPGGSYLYAPLDALGATDMATRLKTQTQLGAVVAGTKPVTESVLLDGVRVPAGPSVTRIEKLLGQSLPRVRLDDVLTQRALEEPRPEGAGPPPTLDELRHGGETASSEAKALAEHGGRPPERLQLLRPRLRRGLAPRANPLRPAVRDSAQRRSKG